MLLCCGIDSYMAACRKNGAEIGWLQNYYLMWPYTEPIHAGADPLKIINALQTGDYSITTQ